MNQKGDTPARLAMLSHDDEAAELHRIMTNKTDNTGSRGRLAKMLGLSESTVRDYLTGRNKHSAAL
jgi:predicted transcriptional regulator